MKNKIYILIGILTAMGLLITACSKTPGQSTSLTNNGTGSAAAGTSLSQVNMLLVGTLKLADSNQAVTAEEAAQLLPLWQAYLSLSNSQTSAEAEVGALLNQIESTMTPEQDAAIKAMNLTSIDMMDLMQSMGGLGPQGTPNPQSTPGADFPAGSFPPGDVVTGGMANPPSGSIGGNSSGSSGSRPSGAGPMPGGVVIQGGPGIGGDAGSAAGLGAGQMLQGTPNASAQATAQARFSTRASQVNTMLLSVLISKLEALTTQ